MNGVKVWLCTLRGHWTNITMNCVQDTVDRPGGSDPILTVNGERLCMILAGHLCASIIYI